MDYLRYWSLLRKPFLFRQGDDFFAGVPQREALAGLSYFVGGGENLAMLVCPSHNGLSWLLWYAKQMRGFGDRATELITTRGDQTDQQQTLVDLCLALGFEFVRGDADQQIDRALGALQHQDVRLVWMLDQCRPHAAQIASEIANRYDNLSVVIGTTPPSAHQVILRLGKYPMRIDLSASTVDDACEYVRYCIERAGGNPEAISDNTTVRLHEITNGMIGDLAVAAESSLALAANHQMDRVTPAVVEAFAERERRTA